MIGAELDGKIVGFSIIQIRQTTNKVAGNFNSGAIEFYKPLGMIVKDLTMEQRL